MLRPNRKRALSSAARAQPSSGYAGCSEPSLTRTPSAPAPAPLCLTPFAVAPLAPGRHAHARILKRAPRASSRRATIAPSSPGPAISLRPCRPGPPRDACQGAKGVAGGRERAEGIWIPELNTQHVSVRTEAANSSANSVHTTRREAVCTTHARKCVAHARCGHRSDH
eukprot:7386422-Prymnesium_polylepis.1